MPLFEFKPLHERFAKLVLKKRAPNSSRCIIPAHFLSPRLSTEHFQYRVCLCGLVWRVLIVLVRDVWSCQPSLDWENQQSFLWMQALKGLEERASYVHFWLELLLRGWWSLGQRLQWAGYHYMKPSVLTGVSRQLQRLSTFTSSNNLTLGKGWSQTYEWCLLWLQRYSLFLPFLPIHIHESHKLKSQYYTAIML